MKGNNTKIEFWDKGKLREKYNFEKEDQAKYIAQEPDGGAWVLIKTDHLKDWYSNNQGGSTLYYTHTTYHGSSYEWVRSPGSSYNGMPYDSGTGSYHNHYSNGGSSGTYTGGINSHD